MIGRPVFLLAMVLAAPLAQASGLSSQSVSYEIKAAADEKLGYAEGQGSYSLTKSCQGWTIGEVYQFGLEKGEKSAPSKLGPAADRIEERVSATEALDASRFAYQVRLRLNGHVAVANVKGTVGADGGKLRADLGTYKQNSDLPAGRCRRPWRGPRWSTRCSPTVPIRSTSRPSRCCASTSRSWSISSACRRDT